MQNNNKNNKEKQTRKHLLAVTLNDKEFLVLQKYIKKYRVKNKANLVRKALFTYILEQFDQDYPTLFNN